MEGDCGPRERSVPHQDRMKWNQGDRTMSNWAHDSNSGTNKNQPSGHHTHTSGRSMVHHLTSTSEVSLFTLGEWRHADREPVCAEVLWEAVSQCGITEAVRRRTTGTENRKLSCHGHPPWFLYSCQGDVCVYVCIYMCICMCLHAWGSMCGQVCRHTHIHVEAMCVFLDPFILCLLSLGL